MIWCLAFIFASASASVLPAQDKALPSAQKPDAINPSQDSFSKEYQPFRCYTAYLLDSLEAHGLLEKPAMLPGSDPSHDPFPVEGEINVLCLLFAFRDSEEGHKVWPMSKLDNPWYCGVIPEDNPWQPGRSGKIREFFTLPIDVAGYNKVVVKDYFEKMSGGKLSVNLIFPRLHESESRWILEQDQAFFTDLDIFNSRVLNDSLLSLVYRYNHGEYAPLFASSDFVALIRPWSEYYGVAFPFDNFPATVPFRIKNGLVIGWSSFVPATFCHEIGHCLGRGDPAYFAGLPDRGSDRKKRTSLGNHGNATSNYDLMFHDGHIKLSDESCYGILPMLAKDLIKLGWIDSSRIKIVNKSAAQMHHVVLADIRRKLSNAELAAGWRNLARIEFSSSPQPGVLREYFLVEFHNGTDYDRFGNLDQPGPQKGLLIQHIVERSQGRYIYENDLIDLELAVPQVDNSLAGVRPQGWNGMRYFDFLDDTMVDPTAFQACEGAYPYGLLGGRHYFLTIDNTDACHYYHQPCRTDFFAGDHANPVLRFTPYNPPAHPNSKGWFGENSQIAIVNMQIEQGAAPTASFDVIFYENALVSSEAATRSQELWEVIDNGTGEALVTFGDMTKSLFVQRMDATGQKKWGEGGIKLREVVTSPQSARMVRDGQGGGIVAWQEATGGSDLFAQRIDSSGNLKWFTDGVPVIPICTLPDKSDRDISMASDDKGGAVLAWFSSSRIRAQRVDVSGNAAWPVNGVRVVNTESPQEQPRIICSGEESFIVWADSRFTHAEIFTQQLHAAGARNWGEAGVRVSFSQEGHSASSPQLINDGADGAFIVWRDMHQPQEELRAQHLTSSGLLSWGESGIAIGATMNELDFAIASDEKGGVIIAWVNDAGAPNEEDIYAQRLDRNGTRVWGLNGIAVSLAIGSQLHPAIVPEGSGGALITWLDQATGWGYGRNLFVQRIDSDGFKRWGENGRLISDPDGLRFPARLTRDGENGLFLAWNDLRAGDGMTDVFMQWIEYGGAVAVDERPVAQSLIVKEFRLEQNYPNPFSAKAHGAFGNPETEIRFQLPQADYVTLKIFNALGEEIRTLVSALHKAGYHRVLWDGKDKHGKPVASGVYLYQLRAGDFSQVRKMSLVR